MSSNTTGKNYFGEIGKFWTGTYRFKEDYIYSREFKNYQEFVDYMEWAVNDYNAVRPHSSLNYLTPDEFEARIMKDKEFKEKSIEKQKGRYEHIEFLK